MTIIPTETSCYLIADIHDLCENVDNCLLLNFLHLKPSLIEPVDLRTGSMINSQLIFFSE